MRSNLKIIAEIGVNHDGDVGKAMQLIDTAVDCGADAVKFQSFTASALASDSARLADYQASQVDAQDQLSMLSALELTRPDFIALKKHADSRSIDFLSTAFDEEWLDFLVGLGIPAIKWPSGELTNHVFLARAASANLPIYLSTGMATMDEVDAAVQVISRVWTEQNVDRHTSRDLIILHCVSLYPAPVDVLNLRCLPEIRKRFGSTVGFSDHSDGFIGSTVAVALGATLLEKHLTYDRNAAGPDHQASLDAEGFREFVDVVRTAERTMGSDQKAPALAEQEVAMAARKSIFLSADLDQGDVLREEHLAFLRPGDGIGADRVTDVVGRVAGRRLAAGTKLSWEDICK